MTTYTALERFTLDIPADHRIVWFDGLDRKDRYAAFVDRYPTTYRDDALCACAVLPKTYQQSIDDRP